MKHIKQRLDKVEVEGGGLHLWLKAEINDVPVRLVVDTGASRTVLDSSFVDSLDRTRVMANVEPAFGVQGEEIENKLAYGLQLDIEGFEIPMPSTVVMDLSRVNQIYELHLGQGVQGILGADIMLMFAAVIDFKNQSISFTKDHILDEEE